MEDKKKIVQKKFDMLADGYDSGKRWGKQFFLNFAHKCILKVINPSYNSKIIDIGCGTGELALKILGLIPLGMIVGTDISYRMILEANKKIPKDKKIRFIVGDAEALEFKSDTFDYVVSTTSFHHYTSPEKVLKETFRTLKSGGMLIISDFSSDFFTMKILGKTLFKLDKSHTKCYSGKEMRTMLLDAGFIKATSKKTHIKVSRFRIPFLSTHILTTGFKP